MHLGPLFTNSHVETDIGTRSIPVKKITISLLFVNFLKKYKFSSLVMGSKHGLLAEF